MRLLPELGLLLSDPLFDRSYPKSGSELTETTLIGWSRGSGTDLTRRGDSGNYVVVVQNYVVGRENYTT